MDPLEALRLAIARKAPIQYDEGTGAYALGDKIFPATAETSWKSLKGTRKEFKNSLFFFFFANEFFNI